MWDFVGVCVQGINTILFKSFSALIMLICFSSDLSSLVNLEKQMLMRHFATVLCHVIVFCSIASLQLYFI